MGFSNLAITPIEQDFIFWPVGTGHSTTIRLQLAEAVDQIASLESRRQFAGVGVHIGDEADVTVVDLLVVVVLDLHYLVARCEGCVCGDMGKARSGERFGWTAASVEEQVLA